MVATGGGAGCAKYPEIIPQNIPSLFCAPGGAVPTTHRPGGVLIAFSGFGTPEEKQANYQ